MTDQAQAIETVEDFAQAGEVNMHSEAAAIMNAKAKSAGIKKAQDAQANRWGMQREVKGHLLQSMIDGLDTCPKGETGRQYGETVIARLECTWGVDGSGKKLSEAEVLEIQKTIPGTKANKAMKAEAN